MNKYSFTQSQLYALVLFAGIIPVITLVLGFHIAWQYHHAENDIPSTSFLPVVQSDESVTPTVVLSAVADLPTESETEVLSDKPIGRIAPVQAAGTSSALDNASAHASETAVDEAFALQLGAFRDKSRAIAWASLKQSEYDVVHLLEREIDGKIYYCVAVGYFDQKDQAREAQKNLAESLGVSSYIIEYQKNAKEIYLSS